jgi:hypothetical protein
VVWLIQTSLKCKLSSQHKFAFFVFKPTPSELIRIISLYLSDTARFYPTIFSGGNLYVLLNSCFSDKWLVPTLSFIYTTNVIVTLNSCKKEQQPNQIVKNHWKDRKSIETDKYIDAGDIYFQKTKLR